MSAGDSAAREGPIVTLDGPAGSGKSTTARGTSPPRITSSGTPTGTLRGRLSASLCHSIAVNPGRKCPAMGSGFSRPGATRPGW